MRQPRRSPSTAPAGTAAMVASDNPVFTIVIARPSRSAGTSCEVTASDIAQNPEIARPSRSREADMSPNTGAMATSTFETTASVVRPP